MTSPVIDAQFAIKDDALAVEYTVTNPGPEKLYLCDAIWTYAENQVVPDPQDAYRCLVGNTLRVGRFLYPVPRLRRVEQTIVPLARVVESGKSLGGSFEFPQSVLEYNPYAGLTDRQTSERVVAKGVELWLSLVAASPELQEHPAHLEGTVRLAGPGFLAKLAPQKVAAATLAVRVRKSPSPTFERPA